MSKEAQKLIHLDLSLTDAKKWLSRNGTAVENTLSWDNKNNIYYRSIAFTNDGYILSHGKVSNSSAINLSGGAGTTYNSSYIDKTYARIDGGTSSPGYFTSK